MSCIDVMIWVHIWQRVQALPLLMGRIFRVLIDPDGLRCIYYVMRVLGVRSLSY